MEKYVDSCTGNLVTPYPNEDTRSYCMNWMPLIYENCTRMDEYQYRTEADRQSKSMKADFGHYTGGGYELRLRGHIDDLTNKIKTLQNNNWIDNRTRALITEFAVDNAQVKLFNIEDNYFINEMAEVERMMKEIGGVEKEAGFRPRPVVNPMSAAPNVVLPNPTEACECCCASHCFF